MREMLSLDEGISSCVVQRGRSALVFRRHCLSKGKLHRTCRARADRDRILIANRGAFSGLYERMNCHGGKQERKSSSGWMVDRDSARSCRSRRDLVPESRFAHGSFCQSQAALTRCWRYVLSPRGASWRPIRCCRRRTLLRMCRGNSDRLQYKTDRFPTRLATRATHSPLRSRRPRRVSTMFPEAGPLDQNLPASPAAAPFVVLGSQPNAPSWPPMSFPLEALLAPDRNRPLEQWASNGLAGRDQRMVVQICSSGFS